MYGYYDPKALWARVGRPVRDPSGLQGMTPFTDSTVNTLQKIYCHDGLAEPTRQAGAARLSAPRPRLPWGLYVHLPFCPYKCYYCDFTAVAAGPRVRGRWVDPYIEALAREYALRCGAFPGAPVSVYYGGGTPTLVGAEALAALQRRFAPPAESEVSVEANPETLDAAGLGLLRAAGFNRLSLGLQAWQDKLLARLGRRARRADFLAAYRAAREAGFDNIGVDLMYGLPGQTEAAWRETLDAVCGLKPQPEHLSAYGLQLEPGTVFGARPPELPSDDAVAGMYAVACARLARAGYEQYEVSNWALPGRRSVHNLLYWRNQAWLGLGVGATSQLAGRRWTNVRRLAPYCAALADGALPPGEEEVADEHSDTLILGLRLVREGVSRAAFRRRFGVGLDDVYGEAVRRLVCRGLLIDDGEVLRLSERGLYLGNQVFAEFV